MPRGISRDTGVKSVTHAFVGRTKEDERRWASACKLVYKMRVKDFEKNPPKELEGDETG